MNCLRLRPFREHPIESAVRNGRQYAGPGGAGAIECVPAGQSSWILDLDLIEARQYPHPARTSSPARLRPTALRPLNLSSFLRSDLLSLRSPPTSSSRHLRAKLRAQNGCRPPTGSSPRRFHRLTPFFLASYLTVALAELCVAGDCASFFVCNSVWPLSSIIRAWPSPAGELQVPVHRAPTKPSVRPASL